MKKELTINEMKEINGGFFALIVAGFFIWGAYRVNKHATQNNNDDS